MLVNNYLSKIANTIVGYSRAELDTDPFARHLVRETQEVKIHQSQNVLPLLFVQCFVYIFFLWNEAPRSNLVIWVLLVTLAGLHRTYICKKIEKKLKTARSKELYSNELWLFFSSINNTLIAGSGFWWIGIYGSDRAVFAITLLCCIYAIGTTINSSTKFNNFPILIIANLGQGILFLSAMAQHPDPIASVGLIVISIFLIQFGKRNSEIFTESIRIRDEIRQQNIKLEKDKNIIKQALATAKEANEDKTRFLAAASHDLRQPLHAMTLFLACLRQTVSNSNSIEIIDKIEETSNTLRDQFNSLLDLSKFDAGVVETNITNIHFDTFLYNIIDGVREEAKTKHLELIIETIPVSINTDTLLLERLIRNLILNAIRYTDQGRILISTKIVSNGVHLIISDTGRGISKEDQEKIFDDFYQINNPSRSRDKGSGLGLAIVKRISNILNLNIKLNSKVGEGSTFDVFFPKKNESIQHTENMQIVDEAIDNECSIENLNIMVVDDDPNIKEALSRLIETWKCTPFLASSLQDASNLIDNNEKIDFAIIDDMLGINETGLQLADFLSTKIRYKPIIVTGNVLPERLLAIENQGYKVFQKPVDVRKLRQEIASIIATSGLS